MPKFIAIFVSVCVCCQTSRGEWFDAAWKFRRPVEAIWDAEHGSGEQLCFATFYNAGHLKPKGEDVRVATDDGRLVASRVIDIHADRVRVLFNTPKLNKQFYVYFGNENPAPPPEHLAELKLSWGLLMESKPFHGGRHQSAEELRDLWDRAGEISGAIMIDKPFIGFNPATDSDRTISRLSGKIFAPADGEYLFAAAADDRAAIFIDGKPALLVQGYVGDIRFSATVNLTRGRHDFVVYHLDTGGECKLSIGWRTPGEAKVELIPQEAFGPTQRGVVGALEELRKPFTADFTTDYRGEFVIGERYLHRYRFSARMPKVGSLQYEWDLGDGQTAGGSVVDHVFVGDGVFPVRCTFRVGAASDSQTTNFIVGRNPERLTNPQIDEAKDQSKYVASYNFEKLPADQLPNAIGLLTRAGETDKSLVAAGALARARSHPNKNRAMDALREANRLGLDAGKLSDLAKLWDSLPADSDLNPDAACEAADFFLWVQADFEHALRVLELLKSSRDARIQSRFAQALLLNQQHDEAKKILESIPRTGEPRRQSAVSGATARTIEFFIRDNDPEAGEEAWETWMSRTPADFLEGYSALLRVQLMELRKQPAPAAKVAEAFACAVPGSSYSPQLLDEASKLMKPIDLAKSAALRELLKRRYPEDPLAQ